VLNTHNQRQFSTVYKEAENCNCHYQIVGVDEANIALHKISFLSPIAKVLLNKKIGDKITLKTPKGNRIMCIEAIEYPQ
jgi:transcription elongation GreA/GreB family factor